MSQKLHSHSIKKKAQEAGVMFKECKIIEDENVMMERKVDICTLGTILVVHHGQNVDFRIFSMSVYTYKTF